MTKQQSEKNEICRPVSEIDAAAALAIKVFIGLAFTAGAIFVVLATVGYVFGVWSTMDQGLAVDTAKSN
jgi:hypothetical protein